MKRSDWCWLLALPVYQLVGTARHELSHAVVAAWQGARITQIEVLPSFQPEGFLWGYVTWTGGHADALAAAAPYLCDLALFLVFLPLCTLAVRAPRWLWINCFIVGLLSPLIDTAANYSKLFRRDTGDVNELVARFSPVLIHSLFLAALLFYLIGICFAWRAYNRD
ncbi:MAG: hypothetical protein WCB27_14350 [Thermoguttaceae bacterium]